MRAKSAYAAGIHCVEANLFLSAQRTEKKLNTKYSNPTVGGSCRVGNLGIAS